MACGDEQMARYYWYGGLQEFGSVLNLRGPRFWILFPDSLDMLSEYCRLVRQLQVRTTNTNILSWAQRVLNPRCRCRRPMSRHRWRFSSESVNYSWLLVICSYNLELGEWVTIPTTYAGGAKGLVYPSNPSTLLIPPCRYLWPRVSWWTIRRSCGLDIRKVYQEIRAAQFYWFLAFSSLDIFGGTRVKFQDLVKENTLRQAKSNRNSPGWRGVYV